MKIIYLITMAFLLVSCGNPQVKQQGTYECVSNTGRPTLTFHSKNMRLDYNPGAESGIIFTTTDNVHYALYEIKDSDYLCDIVKPD